MAPGGGAWGGQWPQQQQQQQKWNQGGQQNWQQQAAQKWGTAGPAGGAPPSGGIIKPSGISPVQKAAQQAADNSRLVVSTGGKDMNEVVIRTLVGEYIEHGANHNRKVYKKVQEAPQAGGESVEVFLYYWDSRDGDAFEGWWFGNQLGGTQVWSHVKQSTQVPPVSGWKIPWDGAIRPSISVMTKAQVAMAEANAAKQQVNAKVAHIAGEISAAEASAQTALEQAKVLAGGNSAQDWVDAASLKQAEELLAPQVQQLTMANQKLMESAKGASGDVAKEFAKLGAKLRITASSVNTELGKLRASKLKAEKQEKQRALEEKDAVMLQEIMPEAVQKTNVAEDAVEKAAITAEMITSGGDDLEEVRQAVDETEKSAREAQTAIGEARIFLNSKLASAKRFESENIRAAATEELGKLLQQLQAAQTKLTPLKTARQDFIQRAAAKKLVDELKTKLTPAEVDVDKAEEATTLLLASDEITKEMLAQTETVCNKANEKISVALKFIESKKKTMPTTGLVRNELEKMEERAQASVSKLNELKAKQKEVQEKISMSTLTDEAAEKLQAVQDAVGKVAETETPFLTGLEELPLEETLNAVKASEAAATSANTSVSIARMFIATKLVEVKRYTAGPSKDAQAKLTQHQKQLEELIKRLSELKKATSQRKKGALMRESEGCVVKAEELVQQVAEAAACFQDDSKLTELTSEQLKEAGVNTTSAEAAANAALADARKFITARQIEAKGKDSSEEVSQMLLKFQTRLSAAQTEVSKYKKLAATVEQRLAAKKSIEDATQKVIGAEEKLNKACELVSELEESSPEGMGEKAHQEAVKAAEKAATEAQAALKQVDRYLSSQTRLTAAAKEEISKLIPRVKEGQVKLEGAQAKMKEASEKAAVQAILSESERRVKEAEDAVAKAKESEAPFAEGKEELPAEEASAAFATLDANAQAAHSAVGGTKTFLAMKRLAAKRLEEKSAKDTTEALTKLQSRLDDATKSLQEVRKGMAARKSGQIKKEMVAKVGAVEKKVAEATEATKALESIEASANFSAEKAKSECEKLSGVEKEAQKMMDAALNYLVEKQKDVKLPEEDSKDLQTRLTTAQSELAKSKKALSEFEQRFVAQKLLAEANQMVMDLENEVEKVKQASAPLLEEGGMSFLAASTVGAIAEALRDHMQKSSSSKDAIFKEAGGSDGGKIGKEPFLAFLEKLPEKLASEDLAFPEDQKDAIFTHIDADKDGEISMDDFEKMFSLRYQCVQQISITDGFEIAKSKTVQKLEVDDVVEIIGEPKLNDANGVSRVECRSVESGKSGWVTVKGNQGKVYLELYSAYSSFVKATEKLIEAVWKTTGKTNSFVKTKTTALANTPRGPLADARTELTKIKPRVVDAQRAVEGLKKKLADSQKEYVKKQEAVVEARDRKAAAMLIKGIKDKVDIMDGNAQKLADVSKPLVSASGADLEAVATPLAISLEAEKLSAALSTDCASVRTAISEQNEAVAKAPKGPMREAKQEMTKFQSKLEATERKIGTTAEAIRKACASLATARLAKASAALRESLQKKSVSVDAFFGELSGGKDVITTDAFIKCLRELSTLGFPEEHLQLVAKHIGGDDGIGRRNFEKMVQQFYQCVKAIAITNEFGISKSKNVRMLELGEVVEVLEGPTSDAKLGITRVKGKALVDGASGWISMKGNQGTPFLKEVPKPCYYCVADVPMDHNFMNANGDAPVRTLKAEEVIEVMEGPRKESYQGAHRAKAKAAKDGAVGWFVMTTKDGVSNAEQSGKFYICTAAIAMTDVKDIKACKVLRKLDQKEVAKVIDGPTEPDESGVQRIHCKSLKDGTEGWITIKGNKGTVYAEETAKLYNLTNDVALHRKFETDGAVLVRTLEKGEAIEILEGPKEEKFEVTRLRGRALSDGASGWVTVKSSNVKPWSSYYKCVSETELTATMKAGGDVIRKIAKDESIEALDGAKEESGAMRLKVRLEKDSAIGWATLKSAEGTVFIQHKAKSDK